jgi:hypothetical protein
VWTILKWILERQDGMVRIGLIWLRIRNQWRALVNTVMNLRVPENPAKLLSICTIGGSSGRAQLRE